jgi:hypothetical protein
MSLALFDLLPKFNRSLGFSLSNTTSDTQPRFRLNRGATPVFTFIFIGYSLVTAFL